MNVIEINWTCDCISKETNAFMVSDAELANPLTVYAYCSECTKETEHHLNDPSLYLTT